MKRVTAIYVSDITVTDPQTQLPIELEVFKDPESGAMFAIDASFTEQIANVVPSMFNKGTKIRCQVPGAEEEDEEL